jgi:hypothetical protein
MHLIWFLLSGRSQPFMPESLVVRIVDRPLLKRNKSGLIVDRLSLRKITDASGKNFTSVNVVRFGGHGAAIARQPS